MSEEQPKGAPPRDWVPRADGSTQLNRMAVERFKHIEETVVATKGLAKQAVDEIEELKDHMVGGTGPAQGYVTHRGMMVWAGGFALAIIAGCWLLLGQSSDAVRQAVTQEIAHLREEVRSAREDMNRNALRQDREARERAEADRKPGRRQRREGGN